jgi:hypothetical protein
MWPEKILYKINKRTAEKKVILEKKLILFKIFDHYTPISFSGAPIFASQDLLPKELEDLIPDR